MAKFKAGQGAGRAGMLMGAARGLWRHGAGGSGALRAVTLRGHEHPKTTLLRGNGARLPSAARGAGGTGGTGRDLGCWEDWEWIGPVKVLWGNWCCWWILVGELVL